MCLQGHHNFAMIVFGKVLLVFHKGCLLSFNPRTGHWHLHGRCPHFTDDSHVKTGWDVFQVLDGSLYSFSKTKRLQKEVMVAKCVSIAPVPPVQVCRMPDSDSEDQESSDSKEQESTQWLWPVDKEREGRDPVKTVPKVEWEPVLVPHVPAEEVLDEDTDEDHLWDPPATAVVRL